MAVVSMVGVLYSGYVSLAVMASLRETRTLYDQQALATDDIDNKIFLTLKVIDVQQRLIQTLTTHLLTVITALFFLAAIGVSLRD